MSVYTAISKKSLSLSTVDTGTERNLGTVILSDNSPAKVVLYGRRLMVNPHFTVYFAKLMLIVINYLCCLSPTVPFGPSIDY